KSIALSMSDTVKPTDSIRVTPCAYPVEIKAKTDRIPMISQPIGNSFLTFFARVICVLLRSQSKSRASRHLDPQYGNSCAPTPSRLWLRPRQLFSPIFERKRHRRRRAR